MKLIVGKRGSGRTTELIKLADKHNGYIVVNKKENAKYVFDLAKKMGYSINFPITYENFINKKYKYDGLNIDKFWIDNVDTLFKYITNIEIGAIVFDMDTIDLQILDEK